MSGTEQERQGPLAGITVVGLEQAISAPLCTRHLADLGARVIKVEAPGFGDSTRAYDSVVGGMSAHFTWLNHGKESATLDLKSASDVGIFRNILYTADVVVSNLAPGALDRLGIGTAELSRCYPRLIVVDISGYGKGGPLDHKRAYDLLIQAEGGSCSITGAPGHPAKPGIPVADVGTALYAYSAVLAALYDRERTGRGAVIPIAMLDTVAEMMGFALNQVIHAGTEPVPVGMGSPMIAPYGAYPTSDGQTAVLGTTNDREWRRLAEMIGRPELADEPRYAHNDTRVEARDELDAVVGAWCAEHTLAEIQKTADSAGIGNARLNSVRDLADHPQLIERGRWREVGTPSGPVPALLPPAVADGWPVRSGSVPALGAHTDAIRAEFE
ncbi:MULTISPECIES: CaiB/BaiF CoA-transferase family protein [unclassified Rhodococcus (in: high G+C Gram-positive bacteria)]|uniref:CaiB/BaiF CoA transferase family protein n=1 Tax=unclassified Rhodococcus (in: high G+C Gram-positive bacteria) TaxID=192944 RepID=UPI00163A5136|nr:MULTISPECIES: CaiB/BaiF CoA-transferase family protein [unclassified Rhodococcus (in: high G+C Gram-positive bacteria)]MBC2640872.1 CoA transferase [Rhodococcus sp. 3A]MBC2894384.1 CoA transferase [Rhodococcus sp. 4CII]